MEAIVLCDTNIFIELFKGNERIINELRLIEEKNLSIILIKEWFGNL